MVKQRNISITIIEFSHNFSFVFLLTSANTIGNIKYLALIYGFTFLSGNFFLLKHTALNMQSLSAKIIIYRRHFSSVLLVLMFVF